MPTCVPIRDMKDTAKFSALVQSAPGPVTVTKNGYDEFVVMRSADYEAMRDEVAKAEILNRMAKAEMELAAGDYVDGASFTQNIRARYGI